MWSNQSQETQKLVLLFLVFCFVSVSTAYQNKNNKKRSHLTGCHERWCYTTFEYTLSHFCARRPSIKEKTWSDGCWELLYSTAKQTLLMKMYLHDSGRNIHRGSDVVIYIMLSSPLLNNQSAVDRHLLSVKPTRFFRIFPCRQTLNLFPSLLSFWCKIVATLLHPISPPPPDIQIFSHSLHQITTTSF